MAVAGNDIIRTKGIFCRKKSKEVIIYVKNFCSQRFFG